MARVKLVVKKIKTPRRLVKRVGRAATWWVEGIPYDECGMARCGPYEAYADAASDRDGMQRVFDSEDFQ